MKRVWSLLAGFVLFPALALAQFDAATVVGTVHDATGAVVAAAAITLTNLETGLVSITGMRFNRVMPLAFGPMFDRL